MLDLKKEELTHPTKHKVMKMFWHVVGVWFLIQLLFVSSSLSANSFSDTKTGRLQTKDECLSGLSKPIAWTLGVIFPITATSLIEGDWCWQFSRFQNN